MIVQMAYKIVYSPEAVDHLAAIPKSEQVLILDQVDIQLANQPMTPTRRRKVLRPNPLAPWVLRLGDLRVFYEAVDSPIAEVIVKAIGKKFHNELWIGGEKVVI
jgi:mRNA-degrading endonuclease RelE of RelBE toxin-antitoxin system